jgi:putative tryptophan/tyrosine transport system substrate-binding protein
VRYRRRQFLIAAGALLAVPRARAQANPLPVIGFLSGSSSSASPHLVASLRRGLGEAGYLDGKDVTFEYRYADGRGDLLPEFVAEFVRRKVSVIVATGGAVTWVPAKAAMATIPLVFTGGADPVKLGLVASLGRPGGNATGVTTNSVGLTAKRLQLLRELVPAGTRVAYLSSPLSIPGVEPVRSTLAKELQAEARASGHDIQTVRVRSDHDLDAAFAEARRKRLDVLLVDSSAYFVGQRAQLVALAAKYAIPASYAFPEFVEAGGLMSYGVNLSEIYRQAGVYAGRILKGAKPGDLPVLQPTVFELALNLRTAKALGLKIPQSVLLRADRVIE